MRGQELKNAFLQLTPTSVGRNDFIAGVSNAKNDSLVLEFGVYKGTSINIIAKLVGPRIVYGFDSFEGLPEAWVKNRGVGDAKGAFKTEIPTNIQPNVRLVVGLFQDSLPGFLINNVEHASFVHIDCDIYSSSKYVLKTLNDRIIPGTVIRFDELCDWTGSLRYDNWEQHEWRALNEWLDEFDREVEPVCRTNNLHGTVKVIK